MQAVQWGWLQTETILQLQHAKWMEQKAIFSMALLCSKVSQNQANQARISAADCCSSRGWKCKGWKGSDERKVGQKLTKSCLPV